MTSATRSCTRSTGRFGVALLAALLVLGLAVAAPGAAPPAGAATIDDAVDRVPPATIRVCRSSGAVETVAFREYVKTVLPREFPASWPEDALRAGAVAIRSYAWYWLENPDRRLGGRCDIGDTQRYQVYRPEDRVNPRRASTDAIVDEIWRWRLETPRGGSVFAQYCNCRFFPAGKHIQQVDARRDAAAGMSWRQIIAKYYRNLPHELVDWTAPFAARAAQPQQALDDPVLDVLVDGAPTDDERVKGTLFAFCLPDADGAEVLATATLRDGRLRFDTSGLAACAEEPAELHAYVTARGEVLAAVRLVARPRWVSDAEREVERIASPKDPVDAAIVLSGRLFDDAPPTEEPPPEQPPADEQGEDAAPPEEQGEAEAGQTALVVASDTSAAGVAPAADEQAPAAATASERIARAVVLARSDVFADALAATALAGDRAPVLLHPGGPDEPLDADVLGEVDRVLGARGVVHLVGGPRALSAALADALAAAGHDVRRHAGDDRVATALAVADAVVAETDGAATVLLARAFPDDARGWADAAAAGSWAAARRVPLLLSATAELDPRVADWLAARAPSEVVVLGGEQALAPAVVEAIAQPTTRVAGPDRAGTAAAIAEQLWSRPGGPDVEGAMLVNLRQPDGWAWAIMAAPYAARQGRPALATRRLVDPDSTGAFLDAAPELAVTIVGPERLVPPDAVDAVRGVDPVAARR